MDGLADVVSRIDDGDEASTVLAAFALANRPDEFASLYPTHDRSEVLSEEGRGTLLSCLLRKVVQPEALPEVAFAIGKAQELTEGHVEVIVRVLHRRVALGDEEFVYQLLIALENHDVQLDPTLLDELPVLDSARVSALRIARRA